MTSGHPGWHPHPEERLSLVGGWFMSRLFRLGAQLTPQGPDTPQLGWGPQSRSNANKCTWGHGGGAGGWEGLDRVTIRRTMLSPTPSR